MRIAVAYSVRDEAGRGASRTLVDMLGGDKAECPGAAECFHAKNTYIAGFDAEPVELEMVGGTPDPTVEAVVVFSRHRAESGRKSLTLHHPGNPTKETLGGQPETLAYSHPMLAKTLFQALREAALETGMTGSHEVVLEATHHGPTSPSKPVVFVELGSTPEDWRNPRGWEALALALVKALERGYYRGCKTAAAFGETHYPVKFTEIQLADGGFCIGHILSRYVFKSGVDLGVVRQALLKSSPRPVDVAIVRKKSLNSKALERVKTVADEAGVEVVTI